MAPRYLNKFRSLFADMKEYQALSERDRFRLWRAADHDLDYEFLARSAGKVLLDLGCGPPPTRGAVRDIQCSRYVGVDFLTENWPDVVASIDRLCLLDESVDSINCASVLEHVYHPHQVIAEMFRVLRPGGCVRVQVPFLMAYHGYPDDYFRYTHSALQRLFEEAGFHVLVVDTDWTKGVYLNCDVVLHLQDASDTTKDIAISKVNAMLIRDFTFCAFSFPAIADSANRDLFFWVESPDAVLGDCITLFRDVEDNALVFLPRYD